MAGVKGKSGSGGARPGAGRPVETVTIKIGEKFFLSEHTPDGLANGRLATVTKLDRKHITLEVDDGTTLTLTR